MAASLKRRLRAVPTPTPESPSTARASFPSARQRTNAISLLGANTYAPYVKWAVDYDYARRLSPKDLIWLAAFSEEYYKGFRRKDETQILPPDALRQANADHAQRRRIRPTDKQAEPADGEFEAASRGLQEHELRGRNLVEDEMVRWLDRPRRVK